MKPEITRSAKAKTGHSLYFNDGPTGMALITTSVERDEVWISMTAKHTEISEARGVAVTCSPFEAMLAATTIVEAVRDFCPEDFDRLWASFKDTIRRERTPITNDTPATYRDGLVPRMDEDTTADVCNSRDEEYMHEAQLQRSDRAPAYPDVHAKVGTQEDVFGMLGRVFNPNK